MNLSKPGDDGILNNKQAGFTKEQAIPDTINSSFQQTDEIRGWRESGKCCLFALSQWV